MNVRTARYHQTSEARAAGNSRASADDLVGGVRMTDCSESTPVTQQTRECPMCEAPGWSRPGGMRRAVCGSEWHDATGAIETTGPACWMLAHRQDRIEELEHEVRELRAAGAVEVAA